MQRAFSRIFFGTRGGELQKRIRRRVWTHSHAGHLQLVTTRTTPGATPVLATERVFRRSHVHITAVYTRKGYAISFKGRNTSIRRGGPVMVLCERSRWIADLPLERKGPQTQYPARRLHLGHQRWGSCHAMTRLWDSWCSSCVAHDIRSCVI